MVHLITAIVKPFKLDDVKNALREAGVMGITVLHLPERRQTHVASHRALQRHEQHHLRHRVRR